MNAKRIVCTVTNDLNYDQRMIRICTTLAEAGYEVTLVGLKRKKSKPLISRPFKQVRLPIIAEQGKLMYAQYWASLFFFLLLRKADILCAIDLDTILPVYYVSKLRGKKRVYDAHELFTDLKEVISRPSVLKMWTWIGNHTVPHFTTGYTIGECYAEEFKKRYRVNYGIIRNATILKPLQIPEKKDRFILYQGWINVGRCFEQLIPAMQYVNAQLVICGEGNFYEQAQALAKQYKLENKVIFKGYVPPAQLSEYTLQAWVGITLFEDTSLSNRLSLANRFFDYMHYGVPQLCNKYAEYERINEQYEVASLIAELTPEKIAEALNKLLDDEAYYQRLQANCLMAREKYCWQQEEKKLLAIYKDLSDLPAGRQVNNDFNNLSVQNKGIKFSVIIPTYNAEATISQAIESVLAQSYPPHEIIVVDDASKDHTNELLENKFGTRIRHIKKLTNQGSSATRNAGMETATGHYFAFLDADDIWHPDKLALINTILTTDPGIMFFYHPFTQKIIVDKPLPEDVVVYQLPFIKLLQGNVIATSCAVIKNDPSFRFEPSMRHTEDYDLWLRIGYKYKVYFTNIPLTQIFRPFTSPGGISENKWKMRKGEMRAYTRLLKLNPLFVFLLPFLLLSSFGKHIIKKIKPVK